MNKKVTVLMPVYNSSLFLNEAIDSILNQSYKYFRFLIINDGSTDNSLEIINSYFDKRIEIISLENNKGLIHALNVGLAICKNDDYIIRMDSDDISINTRVEEQVLFMETHPNVAVAGTLVKTNTGKIFNYFKTSEELRAWMLYHCVLVHPSVIIRNKVLLDNSFSYNNNYIHAEDYKLWSLISKSFEISVIPKVLLIYRLSNNQISNKENVIQSLNSSIIRQDLFEYYLKRKLFDFEINIISFEFNKVKSLETVYLFLEDSLKNINQFDKKILIPVLQKYFFRFYFYYPNKNNKLKIILIANFLDFKLKLKLILRFIYDLVDIRIRKIVVLF